MKSLIVPFSIFTGILCVFCIAAGQNPSTSVPVMKDNEEVARMYAEDQSDREPKAGKSIDWNVVRPRDKVRRARIMEIYADGGLKTGRDYYHAGMILQHGGRSEDYLLCHELCVAAVFEAGRNEEASWLAQAKWLAAASEDRFLLSVGRAQRFGTQFGKKRDLPWQLDKMEDGVTDELRKAWNVPSLSKAKEREAEMNKRKE